MVVLLRGLDEGEAIDIADEGIALGPQHIKTADVLLEGDRYLPSDVLFLLSQVDRVADLLAVFIPSHYTIQRRALARFGVSVVRPDSVDLNIEAISLQELLIDVGALLSDLRPLNGWKELGAVVVSLAEENVVACTAGPLRAIVNLDLMVLCVDWLLDVWLVETLPVDDQVVLILLDTNFLVLVQELIFLMPLKTEVLFIGRGSGCSSSLSFNAKGLQAGLVPINLGLKFDGIQRGALCIFDEPLLLFLFVAS